MHSILTVVDAADSALLTTLARVKRELKITNGADDDILADKISEASSDITAALGRSPVSEGLSETFWPDQAHILQCLSEHTEMFFLRRTPVTEIASVTVDDEVIDPSEYRLDGETGLLFRLDSSGFPTPWGWCFGKSAIIAYTGGWLLPGNADYVAGDPNSLPPAIEGAVVELVSSFWNERGKDPSVRSIDIPGVRRVDYWVGSVGDPSLLPPGVLRRISPFIRPRLGAA